jgi:general stress protein 26
LRYALEQKGTPISGNDMLIAAHALALDAVLVSANTSRIRPDRRPPPGELARLKRNQAAPLPFGNETEGAPRMKYAEGNPHEMRDTFWHAFAASPYVMLQIDADLDSAAPMTASLDRDANHAIWFFAGRDSRWARLGAATCTFASKGHDVFARFNGTLAEETSRERLDKQWSNHVEAWFPGGKDDPNLLFIRMDLGHASIWSGELGALAQAKMALGADVRDEVAGKHVETAL